jgi:hypothetical protein
VIGTITTLVFAFALLAWMWIFELRLSRVLDHAEDLVDRQFGSVLPPEPRTVVIDAQPTVIVVEEPVTDPPTEPTPAVRPRPMPGPRTTPQAAALSAGTKAAEGHANGGTRITDPDIARLFADWEQSERDMRASFEETMT